MSAPPSASSGPGLFQQLSSLELWVDRCRAFGGYELFFRTPLLLPPCCVFARTRALLTLVSFFSFRCPPTIYVIRLFRLLMVTGHVSWVTTLMTLTSATPRVSLRGGSTIVGAISTMWQSDWLVVPRQVGSVRACLALHLALGLSANVSGSATMDRWCFPFGTSAEWAAARSPTWQASSDLRGIGAANGVVFRS